MATENARIPKSPPWYDDWRGELIVWGFVLFTLVAVSFSVGRGKFFFGQLPLTIIVPIDVYLYGFLGAITRAIVSFVAKMEPAAVQSNSEADLWEASSKEVKRIALRMFAALCLAAGIFLASDLLAEATTFVATPPTQAMAGIAFVVGFYVERAYATLGQIADRILGSLRADTDDTEWPSLATFTILSRTASEHRSRRMHERFVTWLIILLAAIITVVVVLVSIEWGTTPDFLTLLVGYVSVNRIPFDVYLYAFIGSMGYVFTSLFDEFDRSVISLVGHTLRVPVGPLLAAGLYLLGTMVVPQAGTASSTVAFPAISAGIAFLVGLYTNVAIVALDAIASRVLSAVTPDESR